MAITTTEALLAFHKKLTNEAHELMEIKNKDYGALNIDPFRNFRQFGRLGILIRMSDKLARLRTFLERGEFSVKDEGVRDTVRDVINYAVLFEAYDG